MLYLLAASLLWSLPFGIIKSQLGDLPPEQVAFLRLGIAGLAFAPFLRWREVSAAPRRLTIGALQFGAMYLAYIESFRYLAAHEVALFTIFTPVWVLCFDAWFGKGADKVWTARNSGMVAIAVIGAGIVLGGDGARPEIGIGFALVQVANICFAAGQVIYRRWGTRPGDAPRIRDDAAAMGWCYLGGTLLAGIAVGVSDTPWAVEEVGPAQVAALAFLGLVASGLGFFLWNSGTRRVGVGFLSTVNNLKVPLAVAVSLIVFREEASSWHLFVGGGLVLAALVGQARPRAAKNG